MRRFFRLRGRVLAPIGVFLAVEFLDELVFGTREAAWPVIRADLGLSYASVGVLLAVPAVVSGLTEPFIGILGDTRHRLRAISVGGVAFVAALAGVAVAPTAGMLLLALAVLYPASGTFVSLSQAELMDTSDGRHERAMARWTFAGSIGAMVGPVVLAGAALAGMDWRGVIAAWACLGAAILGWFLFVPIGGIGLEHHAHRRSSFREAMRGTARAARRRATWRWLVLLALADLMLDVLLGFVALYLASSTGANGPRAGLAVSLLALTGLAGDGLVIPLLGRVPGLRWVRFSALAAIPAFAGFLLVPGFWPKAGMIMVIGLLNSGWYAVLKAQLYASLPGQAGAAVSVSAAFDLFAAAIPLGLGLAADRFGLQPAMWMLLAGPIGLAIGVPAARGSVTAPVPPPQ